jgi:hypothetical protein
MVGLGLNHLWIGHSVPAGRRYLRCILGVFEPCLWNRHGVVVSQHGFAIQAASTNADLAFAVAMFSFFRAFGQTIGVAVGGTVFQNEMKKQLLGYALLASKAEEYSKDASSLVQVIKNFPEGPAKSQLIQSYADALKIVWVTMCAMSAVALILSLWTKGLDLNKPLETEQGFRDKPSDEEKR